MALSLTLDEIEAQFGPLTEIPPAADGGWDMAAVRDALAHRVLWTRVEPGLLSTGLHYVNRECYLRAARPYGPEDDIVEVDPDLVECGRCGDTYFDDGRTSCPFCGSDARL
jgi:hypothetical protein